MRQLLPTSYTRVVASHRRFRRGLAIRDRGPAEPSAEAKRRPGGRLRQRPGVVRKFATQLMLTDEVLTRTPQGSHAPRAFAALGRRTRASSRVNGMALWTAASHVIALTPVDDLGRVGTAACRSAWPAGPLQANLFAILRSPKATTPRRRTRRCPTRNCVRRRAHARPHHLAGGGCSNEPPPLSAPAQRVHSRTSTNQRRCTTLPTMMAQLRSPQTP